MFGDSFELCLHNLKLVLARYERISLELGKMPFYGLPGHGIGSHSVTKGNRGRQMS